MTSDGLVDASGNRNEVYFVSDEGEDDKRPCCTVGDSSFQSMTDALNNISSNAIVIIPSGVVLSSNIITGTAVLL